MFESDLGQMAILKFETIDINRHRDICIQFRRDSYTASFKDGHQRFDAENGSDGNGYIEWLDQRISELPKGCVHVWFNGTIVGQIESRIRDDNTGYINLFYLAPDFRGRGFGRAIHNYVIHLFASLDVTVVRLTASVENERALGYYRHLGWEDTGFRKGRSDSRCFQFTIVPQGRAES